ncbi:MAG: M48 family metallopeptidase [Planctomycetota bacterium]
MRGFLLWAALALSTLGAPSCQTVPITGRNAFNMFSVEQDKQMGAEAYAEVLQQNPLVTSGTELRMVENAMNRLVVAAQEYDEDYPWEVVLIDGPQTVNAFALPGGKMAVYTGILPVAENETGLAVVMGHEIGHVLARHGTQRVTAQGLGSTAISLLLNGNGQALATTVFGVLANGYGRSQELEADHIGLILMAKAGYDPRAAAAFWTRMTAGSSGGPPEWLSTHPAGETRVAQIEKLLPEAMTYFENAARP